MLRFNAEKHQYLLDGVVLPSVTQVLRSVGLINFSGIDQEILNRASALGTAAHQACHYDDLGDLDESTLDHHLKPYLEAWRAFRGDMLFYSIEQPLCHPDYGFAGTPDRIAGKTIIDIKTSSVVYPWTGLQLAGYSILADIPTARRLAVQLKPDGKYSVTEYTDRNDRACFLSCLAIYNWKFNNGSR